ncbi:Aste57867_19638 [Aphanomyces stellatus]|uniref:Aste57867_19638 protein n=1 Tax=Aphanomyces stellatus TaxID=120398 RepID=A0A485LDP9_9STRA|nr:hypothetical protein As57867_019573 [Aphanomyces stellatus]VFT96338.1 Aste57867_19638 [Aphanomyces stellatus]
MATEYTVHWRVGHLGVGLQESSSGAAVISKLVRPLPPHFNDLGEHEGSVGDVLVSIGGRPMTFEAAVEALKSAKLPLEMVFRNRRNDPPSYTADLSARKYSLQWKEGMTLGISFAKHPLKLVTVISTVNLDVMPAELKACNPRVGDLVLSIGDAKVTEMKFHDVLQFLGHVQKPTTICFEQRGEIKTVPPPASTTTPTAVVAAAPYELVYSGERLGIVFTKGARHPVVKETSRDDKQAAVGDELVSIDGHDTAALGFEKSLDMLVHVHDKGSLRLAFRKPPLPKVVDNMFDVDFFGGRLGLVLVEGQASNGKTSSPVVENVTDAMSAHGLELADKGDVLVSVDGVDTTTLGFEKTVAAIKQVQGRKTVLRFRKRATPRTEPTAAAFLLTVVEALFI